MRQERMRHPDRAGHSSIQGRWYKVGDVVRRRGKRYLVTSVRPIMIWPDKWWFLGR